MDDPERFSRILRNTVAILDERLEELREQEKILEEQEARRKRLEKLRYDSDLDFNEFFPYLSEEPYVHYHDSLSVEPDSVLWIYRLHNVPATDTLYDGPRMTLPIDSLAVSDSIAAVESKVLEEKNKAEKVDEPLKTVKSPVDKQKINRIVEGKFLKSEGLKSDLKSR